MCACMYLCVSPLYPLFYPQLKEADRRKSSRMARGEPAVREEAPPVPLEPRLETVALSEYCGTLMSSNWPPLSIKSFVCVCSSSFSFSTSYQRNEKMFSNLTMLIHKKKPQLHVSYNYRNGSPTLSNVK